MFVAIPGSGAHLKRACWDGLSTIVAPSTSEMISVDGVQRVNPSLALLAGCTYYITIRVSFASQTAACGVFPFCFGRQPFLCPRCVRANSRERRGHQRHWWVMRQRGLRIACALDEFLICVRYLVYVHVECIESDGMHGVFVASPVVEPI